MIFDDYAISLSVRNYQPSSLIKNVQMAKRFFFDSGLNMHDINVRNVESYLAGLYAIGRSPKTVRNHRSAIKVFCDYLTRHGLISDNPVPHIPCMELPEDVPVHLPDVEVDLLYEAAELKGFTTEITLALNSGLRMEEMRRLQWRDIDLEQRQLLVRKSKGKRPRCVPINKRLLDVLLIHREIYGHLVYVFPGGEGGYHNRGLWIHPKMRGLDWWARTSVCWMQNELPTLQNLPKGRTGRGWHALRHTFATRAAKARIDVFKLKDWLGHRKVETTLRYIHLARQYDSDIELL